MLREKCSFQNGYEPLFYPKLIALVNCIFDGNKCFEKWPFVQHLNQDFSLPLKKVLKSVLF